MHILHKLYYYFCGVHAPSWMHTQNEQTLKTIMKPRSQRAPSIRSWSGRDHRPRKMVLATSYIATYTNTYQSQLAYLSPCMYYKSAIIRNDILMIITSSGWSPSPWIPCIYLVNSVYAFRGDHRGCKKSGGMGWKQKMNSYTQLIAIWHTHIIANEAWNESRFSASLLLHRPLPSLSQDAML